MKFSAMMAMSVLAAITLTPTFGGFAGPNRQSGEQSCKSHGGAWVSDGHRRKGFCAVRNITIEGSQANQNQQAPPADAAAAAKACADRGGTMTDNFCAVRNITIEGSQANQNQQASPADAAAAAKACADRGGTMTDNFCAVRNITIEGSQANQNQQASPADAAAAAKACADRGGTISTDASGSRFCAAPNIKINGAQ